MRPIQVFLIWALLALVTFACQQGTADEEKFITKTAQEGAYSYEYVTSDPMKTRIYTLDNGLKAYLSTYKDAPRAHVYIAVKAGGRNDPADNTGLAHYLEHMMFKGTDDFGTLDYANEKVLLDSIENLFSQYALIEDADERKAFYERIDETSNEAAKYAIPNEYDKLIAALGGKGLNAYTTEDRTVYTVDIPSNELEKFLEVEGARFRKIVNRLFHTELEAVYEEKNRSLDNDGWKAYEAMAKLAFQQHPYGTQTVIGTIEHLKNPSITEIKEYFNTYYRPNNIAICISGDIDPAQTIQLIDQYFGSWQPNENLPVLPKIEEAPITAPRSTEVWGPDAENVSLAFRFPGTGHPDYVMLNLVDMLVNNAEAGLIDLNLTQQQKVLGAGSYVDNMNDYALHVLYGDPKEGQTLDEVKELLLQQIELLKQGKFEDWLIDAVVTDLKKSAMQALESNEARADNMVMAFTNDMDWADYITFLDKMEKITKQEVIHFVKEHYGDNYVLVYKRNGEDKNKQKVEKPEITKVPLNREVKSDFYKTLVAKESPKLKPVFVDYEEAISRGETQSGIKILAKENLDNERFELTYLLDIGSNNDPALKVAVQYLEFLGTDELTAEQRKQEFYKLGCTVSVTASENKTYVTLSGLDENLESALVLFEDLLTKPKPDQEALDDLVGRLFKAREDAKKNKGTILFSGLASYAQYGPKSPFTNVLSNAALQELQAEELVDKIKEITSMEHRVLYYGPRSLAGITQVLNEHHKVPAALKALPARVQFERMSTGIPKVYWTDYDMVQTEFIMISKGEKYDKGRMPQVEMFNEYFGGGMNSIVFQEIREAQGLAYSVFSNYETPTRADDHDLLFAYVGTQADKQSESFAAIQDLLNNMPTSGVAFDIAKKAILSKIESERITKANILWSYEQAKQLNLDYDSRKDVYEKIKSMTLNDLERFHETYIENKSYVTVLIGDREKIRFDNLQKYGEVQELSLEELFGYGAIEMLESASN